MTESQIERRLVQGVKDAGGLCLKLVSPGNGGVPDRLILLPGGRVIFAELKTEAGRLSAIQQWMIGEMRERGADVRVLKGAGAVDDFLREVCRRAV